MKKVRPWWAICSTGRRWLDVVAIVLIVAVVGLIVFPFFAQARVYSGPSVGGTVSGIGQDLDLYARNHEGRYPDARSWMDELGWKDRTLTRIFRHPTFDDRQIGVAFFSALSGAKKDAIKNPERVPLVFLSSKRDYNASSGLDTLAWLDGDKKYSYVYFVDGHFERVTYEWRFETIVLEIEE